MPCEQLRRSTFRFVNDFEVDRLDLITLEPATAGIKDVINHAQNFTHPANKQPLPRLQHVTIAELLDGKRPKMPLTFLPYIAAEKLDQPPEHDELPYET